MIKITDIKAGDVLIADGGFTCIRKGAECIVRGEGRRMHVLCDQGEHYLEGQVGEHGTIIGFSMRDTLIGFSLREEAQAPRKCDKCDKPLGVLSITIDAGKAVCPECSVKQVIGMAIQTAIEVVKTTPIETYATESHALQVQQARATIVKALEGLERQSR